MRPNVRPMTGREPVPRVQAASTAGRALDPRAIIGSQIRTAGRSARRRCTASRWRAWRWKRSCPTWAKWCDNPGFEPWTVGIEEEVMLLEPDGSPAWRSEDVLRALPDAARRAHARRDARARARARDRPARDRRRGDVAELRHLRAGLADDRPRRSACAPRSPARTRWSRAEEVEVSPGRPLPVPALSRCASSPGASRRSRCTSTSRSRTRSSPCAPSTACARTSRCCWRWRPTRRSRAGATPGWRPRARRSSRPSRAPASRASSAPTPTTSRRSTS